MKKIMISQPMNGLTEKQITETKNRFLEFGKKENMEVVNTYFKDEWFAKIELNHVGVIQVPIYYLAKSLEKMAHCNTVYFTKGWENARGCKIEHEVALQYGLDIIYEDNVSCE
jgi:hypothetical protein